MSTFVAEDFGGNIRSSLKYNDYAAFKFSIPLSTLPSLTYQKKREGGWVFTRKRVEGESFKLKKLKECKEGEDEVEKKVLRGWIGSFKKVMFALCSLKIHSIHLQTPNQ